MALLLISSISICTSEASPSPSPSPSLASSSEHAVELLHPPRIIIYYMHIRSGVNFLQLANATGTNRDGVAASHLSSITADLNGFAYPMTANESIASPSLGYVRGITIDTSIASSSASSASSSASSSSSSSAKEQLFNTIDYNDGSFNGTICQQGQIVFPPIAGTEIAVVGGTGAFRRVQGYSIPTLASLDPIIFRWEVHLFYPMSQ
jgi:hypothetical protein